MSIRSVSFACMEVLSCLDTIAFLEEREMLERKKGSPVRGREGGMSTPSSGGIRGRVMRFV